jgi:hypothetical protein
VGEQICRLLSALHFREGYFDLWEISRWQLLEAGLKEDQIEVAGTEGITGRFATVAMLKGDSDGRA